VAGPSRQTRRGLMNNQTKNKRKKREKPA